MPLSIAGDGCISLVGLLGLLGAIAPEGHEFEEIASAHRIALTIQSQCTVQQRPLQDWGMDAGRREHLMGYHQYFAEAVCRALNGGGRMHDDPHLAKGYDNPGLAKRYLYIADIWDGRFLAAVHKVQCRSPGMALDELGIPPELAEYFPGMTVSHGDCYEDWYVQDLTITPAIQPRQAHVSLEDRIERWDIWGQEEHKSSPALSTRPAMVNCSLARSFIGRLNGNENREIAQLNYNQFDLEGQYGARRVPLRFTAEVLYRTHAHSVKKLVQTAKNAEGGSDMLDMEYMHGARPRSQHVSFHC